MLTARKVQLEEKIAGLESERNRLTSQLESNTISQSRFEEIVAFAYAISEGLTEADDSFQERRNIVELLDVRGTLAIEDGQKVVYVTLVLSDEPERLNLSVVSKSTRVCVLWQG